MFERTTVRAHGWASRHERGLFQLILFAIVALGLLLRTAHFGEVASRSPDELVYTRSAERLAAGGLGAYPAIFSAYAADPAQWIYPAPTRVAHVVLFAGVMKLTGSSSAQAGAAVSYVLSVATIALLAWLGRRFLSPFVGLLAAAFLATYPVELELARRAWGEATATFLVLLLAGAACELDQQPRRWSSWLAFFVLGTACLLEKETSIFAFALCGAWLVGRRLLARDRRGAGLLVLGGAASLALGFGLLALLARSPRLAFVGLAHVFGNGLGSNEWGVQNATGPWQQFIELLALIAPFTALMAALGAGVVTWAPRSARVLAGLEPGAPARLGLALLLATAFVAACAFGPSLQYLRIMAPANPSYCLLAALGVRSVLVQSEGWLAGKIYPALLALVPVALTLAAIRDHALYRDVVVRSGMQDLAVRWLLDGARQREAAPAPPAAPPAAEPSASTAVAANGGHANGAAAASGGDARLHLQRSLERCRVRDYAECVNEAQAAMRADPRMPEAWNNLAAGYAGLGLWDDAVRSATRALELRPDFELARNNLRWANEQRARRLAEQRSRAAGPAPASSPDAQL